MPGLSMNDAVRDAGDYYHVFPGIRGGLLHNEIVLQNDSHCGVAVLPRIDCSLPCAHDR